MATTIEELQVLITAKTSGLQKEIKKVESTMEGAQKATESVTKAIESSTKVTPIFKNRMSQLTAELENTNSKLELQKAKLEELKSEGAGVNESAIAQMQKLEQESMNLDNQIRALTDRLTELKEKQKGAMSDFHAGVIGEEIKEVESSLAGLIAKADETGFKMADLQEKMDAGGGRRLQEQIINTEAQILRLQKSADKTASSIAKMEESMIDTGDAIEDTRKEMQKVSKSVNNMGNQFTKAFKRIAKQVLVFAVIYKGIREMQKFMSASLKTNQEFTSALNDLRANLLIAFQPIYDRIIPALTSLIQTLARAMQYVAAFISGMLGKTYSESMKAAKGLQEARKALDGYGKSANALAGFDEMNLIGGEQQGAGDVGGVDFGAVAEEQDISAFDRVSEAVLKVRDKFKELADGVRMYYGQISSFVADHSDVIVSALAGVGTAIGVAFGVAKWGAIVSVVQRAAAVIGAIIAGISWPITLTIAAIAALVGGFVYFYRTNEKFKDTVHDILSKIGEVATWLWVKVLEPFASWLGEVFSDAWVILGASIEWMLEKVLKPLGDFFVWIWEKVLEPVSSILVDVLAVAFGVVSDVAHEFWQKVLVPLGQTFKEVLAPAFEAVSAVLEFLWKKAFRPFGIYLGGAFKGILLLTVEIFQFLWLKVLEPLAKFVGGGLKIVFSNTFDAIGGVIKGLKTSLIGIMNFISGVFTGDWEKAWEGVKDIFKGVFDSLVSIVKAPLNIIIDAINAVISGINKFKINIPEWMTKIPGVPSDAKSIGFNIPTIPKLAIGTDYVARDGLAYLHQGEAVVPADVASGGFSGNGEAVEVLRDILQAVREGKTVQAVISQKEVARASRDGINHQQRRTGRTQLQV